VRSSARGQVWTRRYAFGDRVETVSSAKRFGRSGELEERAGPLVMRLRVFRQDQALVFESRAFLIRVGPVDLPIPSAFTPGRLRVIHEAQDARSFTFTLEARHPWFGVTFRQSCLVQDVKETVPC